MPLYAWKTTEYYDRNDNSKPLTVYTLSETPSEGDSIYTATSEVWDGICFDGTELGKVTTTIVSSTASTLKVGKGK